MSETAVAGQQMTFVTFGTRLRRRWYIVVICLIVGAGGGYGFGKAATKRYRATSQVLVFSTAASFLSVDAVNSFAQLVTTPPVLQAVVQTQLSPITPGMLRDEITATVPANTDLISIAVTSGNPTRAAALSAEVAIETVRRIKQVSRIHPHSQPLVSARTVSFAQPPGSPSNLSLRATVAIGLAIGLLVSLALVSAVPIAAKKTRAGPDTDTPTEPQPTQTPQPE